MREKWQSPITANFTVLAILLENEKQEAVKNLWISIIESLLEEKRSFCIQAPPCVEASIKKVDETICISILNTLHHETLAPTGPVTIWISEQLLDVQSASAYPAGRIVVEKGVGGSTITATELPEFAIITATAKN